VSAFAELSSFGNSLTVGSESDRFVVCGGICGLIFCYKITLKASISPFKAFRLLLGVNL